MIIVSDFFNFDLAKTTKTVVVIFIKPIVKLQQTIERQYASQGQRVTYQFADRVTDRYRRRAGQVVMDFEKIRLYVRI